MNDKLPGNPEPAPSPHRVAEAAGAPRSTGQLWAVSAATVVAVLVVMAITQQLARQPVLVTSLASSTFLLFWQPNNAINGLRPLLGGHLLAMLIGYLASLFLPLPYASAAVSVAVTVVLLGAFRLVHPPAVSTSLVFSYRPHDVSALAVFALTVVLVTVLALLYWLVRRVLHRPRFARWFGYDS